MTDLSAFAGRYIIDEASGCWLWTGNRNPDGYGRRKVYKRGMVLAHRLMLEVTLGPEAVKGLCVMHLCDTPACINPEHLRLGTIAENNADMKAKGRALRGTRNPFAKLTAEQVVAIRADDRLNTELAADYGLHPNHVSRIRTRRVWEHIP